MTQPGIWTEVKSEFKTFEIWFPVVFWLSYTKRLNSLKSRLEHSCQYAFGVFFSGERELADFKYRKRCLCALEPGHSICLRRNWSPMRPASEEDRVFAVPAQSGQPLQLFKSDRIGLTRGMQLCTMHQKTGPVLHWLADPW